MTNQKRPYGKIADGKRNSKKRYVTYRKTNKKKAQIPPEEKESVRIAFLGGINEIGKNMTLYEYGNDMFLVDCGLAFPDSDLPGVDLVILISATLNIMLIKSGYNHYSRSRRPYRRTCLSS